MKEGRSNDEHFPPDFSKISGNKNLVKCDYCPNTFKYTGSTTNIWRHLKAVHKIKGWHEVPDSAQETPSHASPLTNDQSGAIPQTAQ